MRVDEEHFGLMPPQGPSMKLVALLLLAVSLVASCSAPMVKSAPGALTPASTRSKADPRGYTVHQYKILPVEHTPERRFRLYEPDPRPEGALPLVVIGPAGSRLFHGMEIDDGDSPEHIPWVRAGFVVVTFSIDGAVTDEELEGDGEAAVAAILAFANAGAGVGNAQAALTLAMDKTKIDRTRIFAVGHSSAATLALLFASVDPRVSAAVAFAPCTDVEAYLGDLLEAWQTSAAPVAKVLSWSSPKNHANDLRVPVFLFHAKDDSTVDFEESLAFFGALTGAGNPAATFVSAETGGHYRPMIEEGIPKAIVWAQAQR